MFIKKINIKNNKYKIIFNKNNLLVFNKDKLISTLFIPLFIKIQIFDNQIILISKNKMKLGLYKSLILYNINYQLKKYKIQLYINGIGYKIDFDSNYLNLKLGFSHKISLKIPNNIQLKIIKSKEIILYSYNLIKLTQFVSKLKKIRKIDPYKGKGILFKNEIISKKEGKKNK